MSRDPFTSGRRAVLRAAAGLASIAGVDAVAAAEDEVRFAEEEIDSQDGVETSLIQADPEAGFEFPYFLYAPAQVDSDAGGPVLVEPNNTGTSTDDFARHREQARELIEDGTGRTISDRLLVPLVVPVFPRPRNGRIDFRYYTHQLDTETMQIEKGPLERIDLQLLAMVKDARGRLREQDYPVEEGLLLNGFSASGNFANRFTILHPEKVRSVTAGGVNGMGVLPMENAKGRTLNYQIGVADIEELTGEPFDPEAYAEVDQFLYMGGLDFNDTIPFGDAWSDEQRKIALDVYGQNMQYDRFPYTKWAHEEAGIDGTVFRLYDEVTHTPRPALNDIVEFHRRALNGGDTRALGGGVESDPDGGPGAPPQAALAVQPEVPTAETAMTLDAGDASVYDDSLQAYAWRLTVEGETVTTAAGERAEVTVESAGEYDIHLRVVDGRGRTDGAKTTIFVDESSPAPTSADDTETTMSADEGSLTPTGATSPGPGILGTLASVGATGYLLRRARKGDDTEDKYREGNNS